MKTAKIPFLLALLYLSATGIKAQTDSPSPTAIPREVDGERFAGLVGWVLGQGDQKHQKTLDVPRPSIVSM